MTFKHFQFSTILGISPFFIVFFPKFCWYSQKSYNSKYHLIRANSRTPRGFKLHECNCTYQWHMDDIKAHTSDIRMTYEYIRVTYEWHTSDIQVHPSDIQMTCGSKEKMKLTFLNLFDNPLSKYPVCKRIPCT